MNLVRRAFRTFGGHGLPLQLGVVAFVFLICLAFIALDAINLRNQRTKEMAEAWKETANLTRSLSQHAEDTFRAADVSIIGLALRVQFDGTGADKLEQLGKIMVARLAGFPALANLIFVDNSGACIAAARPVSPADCVFAGKESLEYHRARPDSGPFLARPARRGTSWFVPMSRRYNDKDGNFAGIVVAAIGIGYFQGLY